MLTPDPHESHGRANRVSRYVFIGFAVLAAAFLLLEHSAHVLGYLPFLILLACPLMHFFHHGSHGHGGHGAPEPGSVPRPDEGRDTRVTDPSPSTHHHH